MSYLCIKKQEPTAGAKGILCGDVFLPIESYESGSPTPSSQIPSDGLALYVPLSEAPNASEWAGYGSITYKTVDGVPCAYFNGDNSNGLYSDKEFEMPAFTVSIVFNTKSFSPTSGYMPYLVNFGPSSTNDNDRLALRLDNYYAGNKNALAMVYYGNYLSVQNLSTDTWYSAQMKFDGSQISLYLNGELQSQLNVSLKTIQSRVWIGKSPSNDGAFNGYLSSLRVYNRALSDAEIKLLSREFVFNSAPLAGRKGLLVPVGESVMAPPANGLVFYASLSEESSTAETGQALTKNGMVTYQTVEGLPCARFDATNSYLSATVPNMAGVLTGTISIWIYISGNAGKNATDYPRFFTFGDKSKPNNGFICGTWAKPGGTINYQSNNSSNTWPSANYPLRKGRWINFVSTVTESGFLQSYVNGEGGESCELGAITINDPSVYINYIDGDYGVDGIYIADVRMYNRILSASEIQSLAFEHNPTKSLFIPLKTAYGTPQAGQKGIIVRSSQVVGHLGVYSKSSETMPTEGLVFHAPLSEEANAAETGQALTKNGTITYQNYKGIQCAHFSSAYISSQLSDYVTPYPMTFAIWAAPDTTDSRALWSFEYDKPLMYWNGLYHVYEPDCNVSAANVGDWHHIAWSINSDLSSTYYFDGVAMGTTTSYNTSTIKSLCIGYRNDYQPQWLGYLAGFRIYNRALTDAEIKTLAGEYKQDEIKKMFIAVKGTEISDIPQDGLIFHAPFNGNTTPNVGAMVLVGNEGDVAYNTQDGITYAVLPGTFGWRIYAQGTTDLTVGNEYSYICYYRDDSDHSKPRRFLMNMNLGSNYQNTYVPNSVNKLNVCDRTIDSSSGKWHFICIRSNGSVASIKGFLDASTWTSGAPGNSPSRTDSFLAAPSDWATSSIGEHWHGGIFDFAVYNRILTDAEVENLYQRILWLQA